MITLSASSEGVMSVGRLSTHVLDTVIGKPAAGVAISLHRLTDAVTWQHVTDSVTNADGRTDQPLLSGDALTAGTYMLSFHIGDYFRSSAGSALAPSFLDIVPIRFSIADPAGHYHVPLLATPWSYSTYRGS
jgi:5-hydroxyisourate hydrolase